MATFLCDIIGAGAEDDPCRPAIADHVAVWSGFDCRIDASGTAGVMLVEASPSTDEAALIAADTRIREIGGQAALALKNAMVAVMAG